jgi:protoporphyrin/coproporphyrin ferrochelatase
MNAWRRKLRGILAHKGLLLLNLGSPEAPTTPAVRRYLREFLMDRHVIDSHWLVRSFLVHGLIAPTRAPKSAHAYQSVWRKDGSPLIHFSKEFTKEIVKRFDGHVELAMRYGRPSVRGALQRMKDAGVDELTVVPLYPQFAKSSSFTGIEEVMRELKRASWTVNARYLQDFYDKPEWIQNLASNIRRENNSFSADYLLMSYHGLPEHHIQEFDLSGDHCLKKEDCCAKVSDVNRFCYRAQCFATSRALIQELRWTEGTHALSFQSRLGRRPWIKPYTDIVAIDLAKKGVRRLLVACPSFVADCLETLEEIAIRLRKDFIAAGGEDLRLVPAVNASTEWAADFLKMIERKDLSWFDKTYNSQKVPGTFWARGASKKGMRGMR